MQVYTIYLLTYANADPATMLRSVTANAFIGICLACPI